MIRWRNLVKSHYFCLSLPTSLLLRGLSLDFFDFPHLPIIISSFNAYSSRFAPLCVSWVDEAKYFQVPSIQPLYFCDIAPKYRVILQLRSIQSTFIAPALHTRSIFDFGSLLQSPFIAPLPQQLVLSMHWFSSGSHWFYHTGITGMSLL
eukprot:TRINITY_DN70_c0_g1_i1.p1 TRINITY_DN70_c0_g1~~TRINITY_DN70_c0_g1_i1.p1  ORF type:complete len:149 (+),score=8.22 TRINITY_DN70_c0_g1_i1:762-1208(+)